MIAVADEQSRLQDSHRLYDDRREEKSIWAIRESGLGATAFVPGKGHTWEGWEDSAVDPKHLGKYLRELRALLDKYGYSGDLVRPLRPGLRPHAQQFRSRDRPRASRSSARILDEAADLCVKYNGSLSGEHGDGQSRADAAAEDVRPGAGAGVPRVQVAVGSGVEDESRQGGRRRITRPRTSASAPTSGRGRRRRTFSFPTTKAASTAPRMRCVGVGKCRRMDGGTMCPSFMVTREEEHSTRGRARLLFEMFEGKVIPASWNNEAVKDSLDLCLACKGCKGDCPVNVDMATYKAEFLSHYYERQAASGRGVLDGMDLLVGADWPQIAPALANAMMSLPMFKTLGGVAPRTADAALREDDVRRAVQETPARLRRRSRSCSGRTPSTITSIPATANAAAEVLEAAGYEVIIPRKRLCCGRPLYDWGFLGMAKTLLRETMEALRPELDAGIPIVGLEPSCVSVFRDELPNLFPSDDDAKRLSKAVKTLQRVSDREKESIRCRS